MSILDEWGGTGKDASWSGKKTRSKEHRLRNLVATHNARKQPPVKLPKVSILTPANDRENEE